MGEFAQVIEELNDELSQIEVTQIVVNPKISIIIPVYNVEDYIYDCLISIIKQDFKDIEIIIVDDGSTDNTYSIISTFAQKDSRIKIFKQENKKVGTARNNGLKISKGEYIWFVDGDDLIEKNCLSKIYKTLKSNNSDVFFTGAHNLYANNKLRLGSYSTKRISSKFKNRIIEHSILEDIFRLPSITGSKICKRKFLLENNILFQEGCSGEDQIHFISATLLARKVYICDKNFYIYRRNRKNSLTYSKLKTDNSAIMNFYAIEKFLKERKEFKKISYNILDKYFIKTISWLGKCTLEYKKTYFDELKVLQKYLKKTYPQYYWSKVNFKEKDSYILLKIKIFTQKGIQKCQIK